MSGQGSFAAALRDPEGALPEGLRAWNRSDPARRFAVYRNNVAVSLIDALADTFPVTLALVGEDFFRAMARVFFVDHPPRSRVMAWYGGDFPDFVAVFPPAASVPYLADVARLEYLRVLAFHAADAEAVSAQRLSAALADPQALCGARLCLHPSVHVLSSAYAVASLWGAHQGVMALAEIDPGCPECAVVLRAGLAVEVLRVAPADGVLIAALRGGMAFGSAVAEAQACDGAFDPSPALALLLQKGGVVGLELERGDAHAS